ncbi:hypothetical protein [Novosphingobium sp. B-7]|uniref:hypothetical protein n=1 Tax=Novosphingobium sp. B-7 TaxID=1298855 RepID=UPI0003B54ED6|nr:hypothetical protein [Novosphingobium sp. B-7]
MIDDRTSSINATCHRAVAASGHGAMPAPPPRTIAAPAIVSIWPAAALMLAGVAGLAWASVPPIQPGDQVVVIAPPGTPQMQTLAMVAGAQGALVAPGRFANIAIATSPRVDFPAALRREGAWFVFASPRLAGCLGAAKEETAL